MTGHQTFCHEGCLSGRCIYQAHTLACLIERELHDPGNGATERRRAAELLNEAARLLENSKRFGVVLAADYGRARTYPEAQTGDIKQARRECGVMGQQPIPIAGPEEGVGQEG